MNQKLTINLHIRVFFFVTAVALIVINTLLLSTIFKYGQSVSYISYLTYDNISDGTTSIKFITLIGVVTIIFLLPLMLLIIFLVIKFCFQRGPAIIIEENGIRFCTTSLMPEGFLQWHNIQSYQRNSLGLIKNGVFLKIKNSDEVWHKKPFGDKYCTWHFRIMSLGLWRGEYKTKRLPLGGFRELSNDQIESIIQTKIQEQPDKALKKVEWNDKTNSKNNNIIIASIAFPALALAIGFASNHFSYLWDEEANITNQIRYLANQGDPNAQTKLGWSYSTATGVGGYRDHREAVYWYQKSAEQGYAKGQYNLGIAYSSGRGIKRDYVKAYHWLTLAAEQNQPNSKLSLGYLYHSGKGVEQSYPKAFQLYQEALELGIKRSYRYIGFMYEKGQSVETSVDTAIEYYKKAAKMVIKQLLKT